MAEAERVLRELASKGVTREDHVVALGGGVVGDLAGFCAHLYQRGVAVVQVPTTLVAQVDSAYGGKTGVDLPEGKNYVGAYQLPAAVLADTETLRSLPAEELAAGFVEVLKTGLLAGGALWERVRAIERLDPADLDDVVFACARYKCEVVAADERDGGLRHVLNLGHTVGHAIEAATGYSRYRHGEAVGLGLLAALRLSEAPSSRAEVEALLRRHGLPTALDPVGRGRRRCSRRCSATRSGPPRGSASSCSPSPASRARASSSTRRDVRAAVEELRDDLAPTTASRSCTASTSTSSSAATRPSTAASRCASWSSGSSAGPASSTSNRSSSRPTPRASSSSTCTGCPSSPTRRSSTPAPGPTTAARSPTRSTSPACPRSRSTSPTSRPARTGAPISVFDGLVLAQDLRQGPRRLPRGAGGCSPPSWGSRADGRRRWARRSARRRWPPSASST